MRRVTEACIAVAASATLAGCGVSGSSSVEAGPNGFSATVPAEVQQDFTEIDTYWERTRGLGETGIKLVMIEDRQSFTCVGDKNVTFTSYDGSPANYCRSSKTIAVSRRTWEGSQKDYVKMGGSNPNDYSKLLIGHEYGHGLQQLDYERLGLSIDDIPADPSKNVETQADCIDGVAMKGLNETTLSLDTWFDMVGDHRDNPNAPDAHGTATERKAAYLEGQEPYQNCGLVIIDAK